MVFKNMLAGVAVTMLFASCTAMDGAADTYPANRYPSETVYDGRIYRANDGTRYRQNEIYRDRNGNLYRNGRIIERTNVYGRPGIIRRGNNNTVYYPQDKRYRKNNRYHKDGRYYGKHKSYKYKKYKDWDDDDDDDDYKDRQKEYRKRLEKQRKNYYKQYKKYRDRDDD